MAAPAPRWRRRWDGRSKRFTRHWRAFTKPSPTACASGFPMIPPDMTAPDHSDEAFLQRVLRWQDGSLGEDELTALEHEMMASEDMRRAFAELQMRSMLMNEALRREAYAPAVA